MNRNQLVEMVIGYKAMMQSLDALEKYKPPFTEAERIEIKKLLDTKMTALELDLPLLQSLCAGNDALIKDLENKFFQFALEDTLNEMQIQYPSKDS